MINKLDSKSPTENVGQGLTGPGDTSAGGPRIIADLTLRLIGNEESKKDSQNQYLNIGAANRNRTYIPGLQSQYNTIILWQLYLEVISRLELLLYPYEGYVLTTTLNNLKVGRKVRFLIID